MALRAQAQRRKEQEVIREKQLTRAKQDALNNQRGEERLLQELRVREKLAGFFSTHVQEIGAARHKRHVVPNQPVEFDDNLQLSWTDGEAIDATTTIPTPSTNDAHGTVPLTPNSTSARTPASPAVPRRQALTRPKTASAIRSNQSREHPREFDADLGSSVGCTPKSPAHSNVKQMRPASAGAVYNSYSHAPDSILSSPLRKTLDTLIHHKTSPALSRALHAYRDGIQGGANVSRNSLSKLGYKFKKSTKRGALSTAADQKILLIENPNQFTIDAVAKNAELLEKQLKQSIFNATEPHSVHQLLYLNTEIDGRFNPKKLLRVCINSGIRNQRKQKRAADAARPKWDPHTYLDAAIPAYDAISDEMCPRAATKAFRAHVYQTRNMDPVTKTVLEKRVNGNRVKNANWISDKPSSSIHHNPYASPRPSSATANRSLDRGSRTARVRSSVDKGGHAGALTRNLRNTDIEVEHKDLNRYSDFSMEEGGDREELLHDETVDWAELAEKWPDEPSQLSAVIGELLHGYTAHFAVSITKDSRNNFFYQIVSRNWFLFTVLTNHCFVGTNQQRSPSSTQECCWRKPDGLSTISVISC